MRGLLALAWLLPAQGAPAQTVIAGDAWLQGRLTAGTTEAAARLEVKASSTASAAFQVSGVDETPFLVVQSSGDVGLGVLPAARLDIAGFANVEAAALILRNGNAAQIAFADNGTAERRHALRSVHVSSTAGSGLAFLLWTPSDSASDVGTLAVFSVVTTTGGSSAHIRPAGTPTADLVVSDGSTMGGGAVHRAAEVSPSSREWKTDISPLSASDEDHAGAELEALRHATFRYKKWTKKGWVRTRRQPVRRGLIYEESPDVIKGPGKSLLIDERINEIELAMKSLMRRLEAAEEGANR